MSLWNTVLGSFRQKGVIYSEAAPINGTSKKSALSVSSAYANVETFNRCINLIVDSAAQVRFDVLDELSFIGLAKKIKPEVLNKLLNYSPNPYMDTNTFWRSLIMDFLLEGNAYIRTDGINFYYLAASSVEVMDNHNFKVGKEEHGFGEIIHIKDNSLGGNTLGQSRIPSVLKSVQRQQRMLEFQDSYFNSGTNIGLVLETPDSLGSKSKERKAQEIKESYKNSALLSGAPLILDSGMKARSISNTNFKEMDFSVAVENFASKVATGFGIPEVLLTSGNNANIRPNVELFFNMTILPLMRKFESAIESHFAYNIRVSTVGIAALSPDMQKEAFRVTGLVNNGIITGNEGRKMLRLAAIDEESMNKIRIPMNIAGSAIGVSGEEGGRPPLEDE